MWSARKEYFQNQEYIDVNDITSFRQVHSDKWKYSGSCLKLLWNIMNKSYSVLLLNRQTHRSVRVYGSMYIGTHTQSVLLI